MKRIGKYAGGARLSVGNRRAWCTGMAMVGAGSLVFGLAGTASAASGASSPGASGGSGAVSARSSVRPATASVSSTAAGYYAVPSIGFASASATFVVPKATCTSAPNGVGEFVGLFDLNPASGPVGAHSVAAVSIACSSGAASYDYEAYVSGDSDTPSGIKPGDTVVVSIVQAGSSELSTISDLTQDTTADISSTSVPDTAMSIGEYSTVPTEPLTKVTFTKVQVNGQYLKMQPSTQYNLLNGAKTLIKTSGITSPGDTFSLTYKHAS
jgi:hypothetical protein